MGIATSMATAPSAGTCGLTGAASSTSSTGLFGKRSCSVQFVNEEGAVMFKIFVGRNEDRSLKADQLARFEALRERFRKHA